MHVAVKILIGVAVACVLIVGGCAVMVWTLFAPDPGAGERRDAVRATHGPLAQRLAATADGAVDLAAAAERLRAVPLPADVLGLAVTQGDSDDHRIVLRRDVAGRQTSHVLINGAGTVTLVDKAGNARTFDVLQVDSTLADGDIVEIELMLSREPVASGPE